MMESWALIWKAVLILSITLFAGLSVVVTIGGYYDLRRLVRDLRESEEDQ